MSYNEEERGAVIVKKSREVVLVRVKDGWIQAKCTLRTKLVDKAEHIFEWDRMYSIIKE